MLMNMFLLLKTIPVVRFKCPIQSVYPVDPEVEPMECTYYLPNMMCEETEIITEIYDNKYVFILKMNWHTKNKTEVTHRVFSKTSHHLVASFCWITTSVLLEISWTNAISSLLRIFGTAVWMPEGFAGVSRIEFYSLKKWLSMTESKISKVGNNIISESNKKTMEKTTIHFNYPVILMILGFFSSSFSRKIHHHHP